MPVFAYTYTVVTDSGDQVVKTKDPHSDFDNIESWMKQNMPFTVALKAGDKGTFVKEVYQGSDKKGLRIL